jgi:Domain of unknown function (DUF6894)
MPRYYFHLLWSDDEARDTQGLELDGFDAAYKYACGLVRQVRHRFPHADEDWWIEVGDGISPPTAVIPAMVSGGRVPSPRAAPRPLRRVWEH